MTDAAANFDYIGPALIAIERVPPEFGLSLAPPLTSFIGREREVAQISALIAREGRIVTLVGPGGVGKTRLALAVASDLYGTFRHGAACVNLARVPAPSGVLAAIAAELGIHEQVGVDPAAAIATWMTGKEFLLFLDNFEHVLAAAPQIQELLVRCSTLSIMVTSRAPLRLSAERVVTIEPFPLPYALPTDSSTQLAGLTANPSVQLYVDRATAVDPRFVLSTANATAVVDVCRRLDGLPLAIELAAAHSHVLSPAAMLARLDKRLQLLGGGPADQPARLQTIRQTIAWSYDLLSPAAQRVFRAMAVFSGGARLDACEAVCGGDGIDVVAAIRELVEQQLITRTEEIAGIDRYGMLQTILAFAAEQLDAAGEREAVMARLAGAMEVFVAEFRQGMKASGEDTALLKRFDAEYANIGAAYEWLLGAGDPVRAIRIACRLFAAWRQRGRVGEGIAWVTRALEAIPAEDDPAAVEGAANLSSLHFLRSDFDAALRYAERCRVLAERIGADTELSTALTNLGAIHNHMGNPDPVIPYWEAAIEVCRRLGDQDGLATVLNNAGIVLLGRGEIAQSRKLLGEAYRIHQTQTGSKSGLVSVGINLAQIAVVEEDFPLARRLLERSHALASETGNRDGIAWAAYALGIFHTDRKEFSMAPPYLFEALDLTVDMGQHYERIATIEGFFRLAAHTGRGLLAAKIAGHLELAREIADVRRRDDETESYDADLSLARSATTAAEFASAWSAGELLTLDEMIAELRIGFGAEAAPIASRVLVEPATPDLAVSLSKRERDVLQLLVEGCSDRDVAERLFISRRTASQHVSSVFRKLGVTSRAAAVAVALKRGIA